jgi:hypothetical protein
MNKFPLFVCIVATLVSAAYAGSETSAYKEAAAPQPCPTWYADNEWNVGVWGTYVFTGNEYRDDHFFRSDHAWGGGLDAKYFFRRFFAVGVEGYGLAARENQESFIRINDIGGNTRAVGSVLGTFTLRYPIPCSRFAPYVFAGGGAIFGGAERTRFVIVGHGTDSFGDTFAIFGARTEGKSTAAVGQFGAGFEVRLTPHIGLTSDFSWNVIDGSANNFGMVRSGLNFAF